MSDALTLSKAFAGSVSKLFMAYRQFIQQKLKESGVDLTFEMLQVIGILWKGDGINQQELANLTLKDKASMTYLIDNLTKRKLVMRQEDESDRRNKLIFLTTQGKELQKKLQPWVDEMYSLSCKDVEMRDVTAVMALLEKMQANLKEG